MRCIKYLIGACIDNNQHEMAFLPKFPDEGLQKLFTSLCGY
jgi:hypothetical protein